MSRRVAQRIVTVLSIAALAVGFVGFVVYRARTAKPPLAIDVLFAYGAVFTLFLFFDTIGRQAVRLRVESDRARVRPAPRPGVGGREVAPVGRPGSAGRPSVTVAERDVRVERVTADHAAALQTQMDAAVRELGALADRRPQVDAQGHVVELRASEWIDGENRFPFFIFAEEACVGCCLLERTGGAFDIQLMYIEPVYRRRHVASHAVARIVAFARMAGVERQMTISVTDVNHRGRRFVEACGFRPVLDDEGAASEGAEEAVPPAADAVGAPGSDAVGATGSTRWMFPLRE
ncbi:GNAT family N-acetyltransferase [Alicyclobacillus cycloheptanicus]|uniref:GNAT superfamily N-acetyltransferase n=1 Tax=Alicyclobacillus cycloheptanicus TaxID=1457 RepID=A0ABT9XH81_9BACL|nr:GNAT family N-acetyltransferase [Alicyclobacillus cycloheptanicus]MDQ0189667.1 GNAT superfamily N-acetyltransferase [Alicyclobacillus cycloheptanicus]WDL99966.1 GNAT family N-acetyltransferase [Alicyclobacillus cycloheptanicus]